MAQIVQLLLLWIASGWLVYTSYASASESFAADRAQKCSPAEAQGYVGCGIQSGLT
ncbi:MAG: hypothetical protein ACK443_08960 [Methylococcaceae bacterium]